MKNWNWESVSGYGWRADDGSRGKYYSGSGGGSEGYVFGERSCSSKRKREIHSIHEEDQSIDKQSS